MVGGDGYRENPTKNANKKNKKKRGGAKRRMTVEQTVAHKSVSEWVFLGSCAAASSVTGPDDDFAVVQTKVLEKLVFDLHSHSICSDGFLSPSKLVERAHQNGVKVLSLTDHDTMSGIPEAMEAARKFGIKIIPGVEISTIFSPRVESGMEEPVHILAYYSSCGPSKLEELEKGSEPDAEEAVQLISETGGVAVLAHPWALKDPVAIIRRLKEAGLHGIEVYRSDGKPAAYSDLADAYGLVKLGGSDFHGRGGHSESNLGSVSLPVLAVHEFLKLARPIWCSAIKEILENYVKDPSEANLELIVKFGRNRVTKGVSPLGCGNELIKQCLSLWLTNEERQNAEFEAIKSTLSHVSINRGGLEAPTRSE
ncbi:hypothetical protein RJ639_036011 [Escallonia herrerae]|uniref:Polymerase/histidinol phosphatase N-terminal domain-containing protein n=1 Tax=Escallonia herrerae TaxID=1293975 RepID=A0AA88WPJ0_9ASTE|nr:hypothetical protein RJ639_036011 [Escallonia herrerae]